MYKIVHMRIYMARQYGITALSTKEYTKGVPIFLLFWWRWKINPGEAAKQSTAKPHFRPLGPLGPLAPPFSLCFLSFYYGVAANITQRILLHRNRPLVGRDRSEVYTFLSLVGPSRRSINKSSSLYIWSWNLSTCVRVGTRK